MLTGKRFFYKKHVLMHDFGYVVSKNYWTFIVAMAAFFVLIPFSTAGLPGDSIFNIEVTHEQMKFRFLHEQALVPVLAWGILCGILTGCALFHFLLNKKETTIFLSLGMTRTQLFANRCFYGILSLFLSICIPMLVSIFLNLKALGTYEGLVVHGLYVMAGIFVTSIVSFGITVCVCCAAGTQAESILYWAGVIGAPTVICFCMNTLFRILYWGNAWGMTSYTDTSYIREDFIHRFAFCNPICFFYEELKTHGQFYRPLDQAVPEAIHPGLLLSWSIVAAIILLFAYYLLKRRKAEDAQIAGCGRGLSEWLIGISSFLAFSQILSVLYPFHEGLAILFAFASLAVLHLFWRKAFFSYGMTKRKFAGSLIFQGGVFFFLLLWGWTGLFSQTERFLKQKTVTEARVSYVGAPSFLSEPASGSSTGRGYYLTGQMVFDDQEEIRRVKDIQEKFLSEGRRDMARDDDKFSGTVIPYDILFSYIDEEGKEHTWYYDRATLEQLQEILKLEETPTQVSRQAELLKGAYSDQEEMIWADSAYQNGTLYLSDGWFQTTYQVRLTDQERTELLEAAALDRKEKTLQEQYFSSQTTRAVLMFSQNGEYDCEHYAYNLDNAFLYLTDADRHTLQWLREKKLLSLVTETLPQVESITLQRFDPYIAMNGMTSPLGMYFMSYRAETLDEFLIQKDFGIRYTLTETEEIAGILPGLRNGYFMSDGGFLAAVKCKGTEGYIYLFLPQQYVPEYVKG